MKRKYLGKLLEWKDNPRRKPLVVCGTRQVGKSHSIKELIDGVCFKNNYLRIDCSSYTDFTKYVFKKRKIDE